MTEALTVRGGLALDGVSLSPRELAAAAEVPKDADDRERVGLVR